MTALAQERLTTVSALTPARGDYPIKANTRVFKGAMVGLDSAGRAMPAGTLASGVVQVVGKSMRLLDNRTGSELGGAADVEDLQVEFGEIGWDNSVGDPVTFADVGQVVFAEDDHTIARTGSSTLAKAGILIEVGQDGQAYVWQGPHVAALAEADALAEAGVSLQKRSLVIGHADLTDADTSQTLNLGAVLPANARILGYSLHTFTAFAGGTVSNLLVDIGTAGDVDAISDGTSLFIAAVDGEVATHVNGIAPNKLFASAGAQLLATVVSTGDNLVNLTAGAVTIDVLFAVLA